MVQTLKSPKFKNSVHCKKNDSSSKEQVDLFTHKYLSQT